MGTLVKLVLVLGFLVGWCLNLYKFATADFEAPYKTEVVRGIGIPVVILGGVAGYFNVGEENND